MNFVKLLITPILKNICETTASHCRQEKHVEIGLLTCHKLTNLYLVLFPSFIYEIFLILCFCFEKTKLAKKKLYGEFWPVLKHNWKERF